MRHRRKPTIYLASKMKYSEMFRDLYERYPDLTFTSRWPFLEPFIKEHTPDTCDNFWEGDFHDIDMANHLILYGQPGDNLRGALIETGYAIAKGKFVHIIGENENFGTWQNSHRVIRYNPDDTLEDLLKTMVKESIRMRDLHKGELFTR